MQNDDDEILDLVDANDTVVGTILRGDATRNGGLPKDRYIRAANCFIVNSDHKLWIPRRTQHKKIAPGGLDYSAGGHVTSGETYEEAMLHELSEEVGLNLEAENLIRIGKETPFNTPPYMYFSQLYLYFSNDNPVYNPEDFDSFEWLNVQELQQKLQAGTPAKDSLLSAAEWVLAYFAKNSGDQQGHQ